VPVDDGITGGDHGPETKPGHEGAAVRLRDVELGDAGAYVRMRCDPVMTAELGGPLPREGIEDKVARDVQAAAAGTEWIKMIVRARRGPAGLVAGSVALRCHGQDSGEPVTEIGWMVLPEFQGRGLEPS
jgi:RimJ/RimL family protein N-acetyltransferase